MALAASLLPLAAAAGTLDPTAVFVADPAPRDWLVVLPVLLCLVMGAVVALIRGRIALHAPIAIASLIGLVVIDALLLAAVASGGPLVMVMGRWLPPFGIAFTVDLLGASLALVAGLVALAAAIHALSDIDTNRRRYGFYPFLLFLMAGVSGAFLTGDVFNLYVWFEVLLIASFGLVVLGGEPGQIDGALKYGLLNLVGTTLFLIAVGYLYALTGTLNMADIADKVAATGSAMPLTTLGVLFFAAFAMKAAAFPVNFWLPAAYHTPPVTVSALFAGLLTKVGVYAILRVLVMLMPATTASLTALIGTVAVATMLTGAIGAIGQQEFRRALGYWVISGIGTMLAGVAIGGVPALSGTIFYAVHSMLVMTGLYCLAGLVARARPGAATGEGGPTSLWHDAPLLSAAGLVLLFAVAGLPPLSGFWPKAMLVAAALDSGRGVIAAAILVSGFLITFAAGRLILLEFWRPVAHPTGEAEPRQSAATATTRSARRSSLPASALAVVLAFALVSTAIGLWPEPLAALARAAAGGIVMPDPYLHAVFPEVRP
jgi:multicomponent Na+:H+ antiporter subunit D